MDDLLNQLACLSHAGRMSVFRLLMRRYPDAVPAGEIAKAVSLKASTTSVHLANLLSNSLITQTREGTSLLYAVNLDGAQGLVRGIFEDCCGGRPDLCPVDLTQLSPPANRLRSVLFVCTRNAARSIMAEALLRHIAGDQFQVYSAGTAPDDAPDPLTLATLSTQGIAIDGLQTNHLADLTGPNVQHFDFVFTVCDQAANQDCPTWPGLPITAHWGVPDPMQPSTNGPRAADFREAFEAIKDRVTAFAGLPFDTLDPVSLQRHIDAISTILEPAE